MILAAYPKCGTRDLGLLMGSNTQDRDLSLRPETQVQSETWDLEPEIHDLKVGT